MDTRKKALLDAMQGGLIVSCQIAPEDPTYIHGSAETFVAAMAKGAAWAGAVGIRANTPAQIRAIKETVDLPVIGLYKTVTPGSDVYITPTLQAAMEIYEAGAEIIALDCTARFINGKPAYELLPVIKRELPRAILFADVALYGEAKRAIELGADIAAPTLYGYTAETARATAPDEQAFENMCRDFRGEAYIFMEGRVNTPEEAVRYLRMGAHAVVVGSAITRPHLITKKFADAMNAFWHTRQNNL
jgi:N-acylglucosamine-6-phosphate 2-epimerase